MALAGRRKRLLDHLAFLLKHRGRLLVKRQALRGDIVVVGLGGVGDVLDVLGSAEGGGLQAGVHLLGDFGATLRGRANAEALNDR